MRILVIFFLLVSTACYAQDDLLSELEQSKATEPEYVTATFKGSRLVNGQTVKTKNKRELEFIFSHRFGRINDGLYELFGLDQAYVRLGLEYGITDRLGVGLGRNSVDKTMDSYLRYKALRQVVGGMPVTITAYGNFAIKTSPKKEDAGFDITLEDRLSYTGQLLIAKKFTSALSLQLMPTVVHKNLADQTIENNTQFALGAGGRIKVSKSISLNVEYYHRFDVPDNNPYFDALGFAIDIETGGHDFQLIITNTRGLTERAFITETAGDFFDGDIHLGFNVTRTFQFGRKKK